jgi:hypothetical protein
MELLNHTFTSIEKLSRFIESINKDKTIFIQVLCGDFNNNQLQEILELLTKISHYLIL